MEEKNKKSKIAICYVGFPRQIDNVFENQKEYIFNPNSNFDIDVFAHFWWDDELIGYPLIPEFGNSKGVLRKEEYDFVENVLKNELNLKKIVWERPRSFSSISENRITPDSEYPYPLQAFISEFYSLEKSIGLKNEYEKENNFKYDVVVKLRSDTEFFNTGNFPFIFSEEFYNLKCINLYNDPASRFPEELNTAFMFGDSELMDKISNVYSNFSLNVEMGARVIPEYMIGFNAIRQNIPVIKHDGWYWGAKRV